MRSFLILAVLLIGCNSSSSPPLTKKETYQGRSSKNAVYHAEVPLHWKRMNPSEDIRDTRIPICAYEMEGGLLTIHTFPYISLEQRISPEAQIERWKKQAGECEITSFAKGGFGGFRLESDEMIAYAMQLSPLLFQSTSSELQADYTLKFVGKVAENKSAIDAFAVSFEWIQPLNYENL